MSSLLGKRNNEIGDLREQLKVQAQIIRELGEANACKDAALAAQKLKVQQQEAVAAAQEKTVITDSMTGLWATNPRREAYAYPFERPFSTTEENGVEEFAPPGFTIHSHKKPKASTRDACIPP
ncbi:hypothetical protein N0V91_005763 [Didymella pomorum]|uniref:Uncharacterized protein n=1 Tax=Didymella pomorum TaxID=749634 RepID=A0A9W9D6E0_9PLEO|nr:hypothetical protein N0V91_005763 [Didymella pomorum]